MEGHQLLLACRYCPKAISEEVEARLGQDEASAQEGPSYV